MTRLMEKAIIKFSFYIRARKPNITNFERPGVHSLYAHKHTHTCKREFMTSFLFIQIFTSQIEKSVSPPACTADDRKIKKKTNENLISRFN